MTSVFATLAGQGDHDHDHLCSGGLTGGGWRFRSVRGGMQRVIAHGLSSTGLLRIGFPTVRGRAAPSGQAFASF